MNKFFSDIYEFFYFSDPFSSDMFNEGLYSPIALSTIIVSFFMVILFYYIINRPSFSRWYHWSIILGLTFSIAFLIGFAIPRSKFNALGLEYGSEYYLFAVVNSIVSLITFLVFSFCLRWWSSNAKSTPIPN